MHASEPLPAEHPVDVNPPEVSVVLPVFNGAGTIRSAIDSLLSQTGVELELIVVDDGSTDRTPEILLHYGADPRVRVLRQEPNQGLVAALNRGLAAATHDLVARLDADDAALPGRLAHQAAVLLDDPAVLLTACGYERVLPSGEVRRRPVPPRTLGALAMVAWSGNRLCHSAVMFRRTAVLSVGGYRSEWYPVEDYDLWLRLLAVGGFRGTSFIGTRYLENPDGISLQHEQRQADLVRQRSDEYGASLGAGPRPTSATPRPLLRHLEDHRAALRRHLTASGASTAGVDATAYQLAVAQAGSGGRLVRHLRLLSVAPALWLTGRRRPDGGGDAPLG
ncbi:MAG: glycosyltransferase [Ilumatobacteraceae bacterium]